MGFKQVWLSIKVNNFINVKNKNGIWHCHAIIEEEYLDSLKNLIVYENWEDVPDDFKNANGGLLHSYSGFSYEVECLENKTINITIPIGSDIPDGYGI